ncbi:MAG: YybH family protein [Sediminibacterium sp.]|jgi:ketosteroid isomerase-like protein|nr:hypothetical protein [Chitinophagaceae bacterium]MCA6447990.1 hypothetical protein [Chitinophagaceae bacterium]
MLGFISQKNIIIQVLTLCAVIPALSQSVSGKKKLMEEIRTVEKQFETDLNKFGADFAFYKYAAPQAVIKRENDTLIFGANAIKNYYKNVDKKLKAKAYWAPDFIDVSEDGSIGYTYGKYRWVTTDSLGKTKEYRGIFHTIWKKQVDGSWKYVWD